MSYVDLRHDEIDSLIKNDAISTLLERLPDNLALFGQPGKDFDAATLAQMVGVMNIEPAVYGALMPDGHLGYAMPIGGVVALENAVSPSFVGYDIACRVTMSYIEGLTVAEFMKCREAIAADMAAVTSFGVGSEFKFGKREHVVMDDPLWVLADTLVPGIKAKAQRQLGSSGGGNHFFDALVDPIENQVAIMTHSGSRGAGHNLATFFTRAAKQFAKDRRFDVPGGYEWLPMDSEIGNKYWYIMQLMGQYAQANHHLIHSHFFSQSGLTPGMRFENHHNFAWQEGDLYIHRKGATPAAKDQVGLIPGTCATPSFVVMGLGNEESLMSSSHGAGRAMSRKAAKAAYDPDASRQVMDDADVLHSGLAPDEQSFAYKDVGHVIKLQEGVLFNSVQRLYPKIVIMGGKSDDGD